MYCDRAVTKPLPFTPLDWNCPAGCIQPILLITDRKFPLAQGAKASELYPRCDKPLCSICATVPWHQNVLSEPDFSLIKL